nr:RNA-directed DNA polymerase, eukaryota, reverse transcriptase zinc-binding domain protein [Tanacetum cinerariifolium]
MLWDYLVHVISKWDGEVIVMRDFNEVRFKNERFGSLFHAHRADAFNRFILQANLQEIPLGGCSFTWCHRSAKKMSKLDRFLMSEGLLGVNPNFSALTFDSKRSIWVSWNKVLTSKKKGGLGVSSLFALNRALMFKWVWRFFNQSYSLWVRVIHAIHGVDGRIGRAGNVGYTSIWCDIIKEMDRLASHGIDLISMMHKKIGNGLNNSFWENRWRGEQRLKEAFLRIYALEDHLLDSLEGVMLNPSEDRWSWDLNGLREFLVASAR